MTKQMYDYLRLIKTVMNKGDYYVNNFLNKKKSQKSKRDKQLEYVLTNALSEKELRDTGRREVMIIDDCSDTLNIIRNFLSSSDDINVWSYQDEFTALENFKDNEPDLVVLDINLTVIDGLKVSSILKSLSILDIPVLYMSSDPNNKIRLDKFHKGSTVDFIQKPLKQKSFISNIQNILNLELSRECA